MPDTYYRVTDETDGFIGRIEDPDRAQALSEAGYRVTATTWG